MKRKIKKVISIFTAVCIVFSLTIGSMGIYADVEGPDNSNKRQVDMNERPAYKEGELLIKFKDGISSAQKAAFASGNGLEHKKSIDSMDVGLYSVKNGSNIAKAMRALTGDDEVEYVQPNYLYYPAGLPNDADFDKLWGLKNIAHGVDIDALRAWDITRGMDDIVVAVIDTGIDTKHPELSGRMWMNPGETGIDSNGRNKATNHIDDDGNGYKDDVYGWDFYSNNRSVYDDEYFDEHGTHVAGTIAAEANSQGIIGVAPAVKIMSLKFLGPRGGTTADAIDAINYAKMMGAKIANASWGGPPEGEPNDRLLKEAIERSGMLFVASAGNDGVDIDVTPDYPGSYDSSNILTVAAVDSNGRLASFSNYGRTSVDIAAPGVGIYSTVPARGEGIAAVGVPGRNNTFVAAFGLEDLVSQSDADELLSKALSGVGPDASILLVDDDGNNVTVYEDVYGVYDTALKNGNYTNIDVVRVYSDIGNGPSYGQMNSHDIVIWFTGEAFGWDDPHTGDWVTTLTEQDQLSLMSYLKAGGRLILFGQDALYGLEDSELLNNYFDIEIYTDHSDYGKNRHLEGADTTVFEAVYYDIQSGPQYLRDYLWTITGDSKALLYYPKEPDAYYSYMDGTSMAAPHVTGIAALLLSKNPDLTPEQLKLAILNGGRVLPGLSNKTLTGKMASAYSTLKRIAPAKPTNLAVSQRGSNITLTWSGREAGDFKSYIVERKIGSGEFSLLLNTENKTYTDSGIDTGTTYWYRVKAEDDSGNISDYSNVVVVNASAGGSRGSGGSSGGGGGGGGGGSTAGSSVPGSPDPSIDSKIQNAAAEENIAISMIKLDDIESVEMSIKTVEGLSKSGKSLALTGSNVQITIPVAALMTEEVKKYTSDSTVKLRVNIKEIKGEVAQKLTSNVSSDMFKIGDRVFEFTVELKTSKGTININKFEQELKLGIKLNTADTAGIDVNKLGVYYYNEESKAWEYVGGVYDPQNGTIAFYTNHLSKYAVMRTDITFTDIGKHWAKAEIELMAAKHVIGAAANTEFGPDEKITRAEVVRMLVNMLRYAPGRSVSLESPQSASFKDVGKGDQYFAHVETALKHGIIKMSADRSFNPEETITREQLATMIMRALGIEAGSDLSGLNYDDKDKIPAWAAGSISAAYDRGYIQSMDGKNFGVGYIATRAQAAVIIKRVMDKSGMFIEPAKLTGKLSVNDIEGRHFELETENGLYVLVYDSESRYLAKLLDSSVGKNLEVSGYVQSGYSIYQRGEVFRVISITLK